MVQLMFVLFGVGGHRSRSNAVVLKLAATLVLAIDATVTSGGFGRARDTCICSSARDVSPVVRSWSGDDGSRSCPRSDERTCHENCDVCRRWIGMLDWLTQPPNRRLQNVSHA